MLMLKMAHIRAKYISYDLKWEMIILSCTANRRLIILYVTYDISIPSS